MKSSPQKYNAARSFLKSTCFYGLKTLLTLISPGTDIAPRQKHKRTLSNAEHTWHAVQNVEVLFLATSNRADIYFTICALARNVDDPTDRHVKVIIRVLQYLPETSNTRIKFRRWDDLQLMAHSYSDWYGTVLAKLNNRTFFTISGAQAFWNRNPPSIIAFLSAEAKFEALITTSKEISWPWRFHREVYFEQEFTADSVILLIPLLSEGTTALPIGRREEFNAQTKHIGMRYHHVRDLQVRNEVTLEHVTT